MIKFLLDSNTLIEARNRYYGFDLCPGFWDCLQRKAANQELGSINRVFKELAGGGDDLSDWATSMKDADFFLDDQDRETQVRFRQIANAVQTDQQFMESAKTKFLSGADPWLIAKAGSLGATVVTHEGFHPEAKKTVPIPNICKRFRVEYIDTFAMLRRVDAKFELAS